MVLVIFVLIAIGAYFITMRVFFRSLESCRSACDKIGYSYGNCQWPREIDLFNKGNVFKEVKKLGPYWDSSKHCGHKSQCDCYCWR